ncbi:iron-containing alcohol dehydrogenase [Pollutimonas harenae]|uniref:Iron-containing alcohol dehydrogenase n=1 Tax=Pollutimonas harenae TaxID=657015 RepID=A0A853GRL9_9BURK|nr:iron-containing alcohol dehydrogenase [Pollutimonas harenae]NYT84807.1 iron-containing alcohol dehydrogenase [Pollutimonas harenae]TEA72794.1 iron-containing alcohol dehydrogenase [Pollutimonas harenae]
MGQSSFDFYNPTEIRYGAGVLSTLPALTQCLGIESALLVCDPGIIKAGLVDRVANVLKAANIPFTIFSDIESDPEVRSVDEGVRVARAARVDGVIGVGGGSALDTAKAIAIMLTNEGTIRDYFGIDKIKVQGAPVIAIPTTAGTGSEVTVWSVLSDTENNVKANIGSYLNCPRIALLDPELTTTLPAAITAATGMDALTHAIESYVNKAAHVFSESVAEKSIALIANNLRLAVLQGDNIEARGNMLIASTLAGMSFNRIRLGLAHAFALPLGNLFHIPHGLVNSIMLTPVMKFNLPGNLAYYAKVAELFGERISNLSVREAAERSVLAVHQLKQDIGLTKTLADFNVSEDRFDEIIDEAMRSGNVPVNPRMPTRADMRQLLMQAMTGEI